MPSESPQRRYGTPSGRCATCTPRYRTATKMASSLTTDEERLVERYLSVLDFIGRCVQAVDEGHWHYLWDKAGQLSGAASRLEEELAESRGKPRVRVEAVLAGV